MTTYNGLRRAARSLCLDNNMFDGMDEDEKEVLLNFIIETIQADYSEKELTEADTWLAKWTDQELDDICNDEGEHNCPDNIGEVLDAMFMAMYRS